MVGKDKRCEKRGQKHFSIETFALFKFPGKILQTEGAKKNKTFYPDLVASSKI